MIFISALLLGAMLGITVSYSHALPTWALGARQTRYIAFLIKYANIPIPLAAIIFACIFHGVGSGLLTLAGLMIGTLSAFIALRTVIMHYLSVIGLPLSILCFIMTLWL